MSGGPAAPSTPGGSGSGWSGGRTAALILGSIVALLGAALLLAGLGLLVAHAVARDDDGYYSTDTERLSTRTYALTLEDIDLGAGSDDWVPKDVLGRVRIRAEEARGRPVFVGIGPEDDVAAYLAGVAHAEVEELGDEPRLGVRPGGRPRRLPARQRFWVASAEGPGRQSASWEVEGGRWAVVVMRADGARPVVVEADLGAKVGWLIWVGIGLAAVGALIVAVGMLVVVAAARAAGRSPAGPPGGPPAGD